jgi:probable HAF family extracellular repeat protein
VTRALNDAGDVVGATNVSTGRHPFLLTGGRATDLGTLGGTLAYPVGVNNTRQVAGNSALANGSSRAFLWRAGEMIAITPPTGYATTAAAAITEQGDVLGSATTADGSRTVYLRWTIL